MIDTRKVEFKMAVPEDEMRPRILVRLLGQIAITKYCIIVGKSGTHDVQGLSGAGGAGQVWKADC